MFWFQNLFFNVNFIIVLQRILARNLKYTIKLSKNVIWRSKTKIFEKNMLLGSSHMPQHPTVMIPEDSRIQNSFLIRFHFFLGQKFKYWILETLYEQVRVRFMMMSHGTPSVYTHFYFMAQNENTVKQKDKSQNSQKNRWFFSRVTFWVIIRTTVKIRTINSK